MHDQDIINADRRANDIRSAYRQRGSGEHNRGLGDYTYEEFAKQRLAVLKRQITELEKAVEALEGIRLEHDEIERYLATLPQPPQHGGSAVPPNVPLT